MKAKNVQIAWGFTKRQGVHAEFASARITAEKHAKSQWPVAVCLQLQNYRTALVVPDLLVTIVGVFVAKTIHCNVEHTPGKTLCFIKGKADWSVVRNIGFTCGFSVLVAVLWSKCSKQIVANFCGHSSVCSYMQTWGSKSTVFLLLFPTGMIFVAGTTMFGENTPFSPCRATFGSRLGSVVENCRANPPALCTFRPPNFLPLVGNSLSIDDFGWWKLLIVCEIYVKYRWHEDKAIKPKHPQGAVDLSHDQHIPKRVTCFYQESRDL